MAAWILELVAGQELLKLCHTTAVISRLVDLVHDIIADMAMYFHTILWIYDHARSRCLGLTSTTSQSQVSFLGTGSPNGRRG